MVSRGPCPQCDSSRRFLTYADGHSHCHACGHHVPASGGEGRPAVKAERVTVPSEDEVPVAKSHEGKGLEKRKLHSSTLQKYGYYLGGRKGKIAHVSRYYSDASTVAWQKVRYEDKTFETIKITPEAPSIVECWLFGRQVYGDRFDRRVIVTTGEIDAMSIAQVLDFRVAVVSVNAGDQSAAKNLKANYLWLDRFQEIVLWFDDDESGNAAVEECAKLFKVGKVRIAKARGFKDASEALQANKPGDIEAAIYGATMWKPKGIVNARDNSSDVTKPKDDDTSGWRYHWPWPEMDEMLGPILPGQVCYHVAGTGIGKSTGVAEIAYSLQKQGATVAWMGFEDTRRDTKLRLMSIHVSDRLDIEPRSDEEMIAIHDDLFGPGNVWLFDPETAEWNVDAILSYVRFCAKALDCQVIFLDPLSFIAAGMPTNGENAVLILDRISRDLAALAKELGVHLQITHHLRRAEGTGHEEGAETSLNEVRGSGGIAMFASTVVGHERNQQAEGDQALITQLRILKNRPRSRTGVCVVLKYDLTTGRLTKTDEPFPGPKGAKGGGGRQRFGAVPAGPQSTDY